MAGFNINWRMLVAVIICYYGTIVFYRLFLHPLARFPGSKLAAISRWYEAYYDVVQGGQYTAKIAQLHTRYGPIIRISPHELHVIDPAFYNTLYRMDGRWDKYSWTYDAFGAKRSTIFISDHNVHKMRRSAIAPFFSKPRVADHQDLLRRNIDKLCQRTSKLAGNTFNLGAAISAFTRDTGNEFVVGKRYNELDLESFGVELSIASQGAGPFWRITKHMHWFGPAMRGLPVSWAMKVADDGTKAFLRFLQQSEQDTRDTLAAAVSFTPNDNTPRTMIHEIVDSNLPPSEKTFDRIFEDVATVTAAAYETTANALRLILYHIYSNEKILHTLRAEIASLPTDPTAITLKELERLPYLTAVLTEGLRLSPGIGTRAARVTDKDLFYNNWRIPAGTPVGMTTMLMHTDEKIFPDPMSFNPDRWTDPTIRKAAGKNFAPFSRGTRICLGMHLAWAEMYLLVNALVRNFDFTFKDATADDFLFERDNFGIGTKAGCNLFARAHPHEG
ncbi:cytochrome P450 [Nemania abortiva]|nr:cytochrome P450 [Nemania abortiva]